MSAEPDYSYINDPYEGKQAKPGAGLRFFLGFCQLRVFFPEAHDREGDYAELQQRYDNRPRRGYNDIRRAGWALPG